MVIDVQTGETHAASVMTWLFNQCYDSYPPTQTESKALLLFNEMNSPFPSAPPPDLLRQKNSSEGIFLLRAH